LADPPLHALPSPLIDSPVRGRASLAQAYRNRRLVCTTRSIFI